MLYSIGYYINRRGIYYCIFDEMQQKIINLKYKEFIEFNSKTSKKKLIYVQRSKIATVLCNAFGISRDESNEIIFNLNSDAWRIRYEATFRKLTKEESIEFLAHIMTHKGSTTVNDAVTVPTNYSCLSEYVVKSNLEKKSKIFSRLDVMNDLDFLFDKQQQFENKFINSEIKKWVVKNLVSDNDKFISNEKEFDENSSIRVQLSKMLKEIFHDIPDKFKKYMSLYFILDGFNEDKLVDKYDNKEIKNTLNKIKGSVCNEEDILKYKLFMEQNGVCLYSQESIDLNKLFDKEYCETDHIIPKSISNDDSVLNKALVMFSENRDKKCCTPWQYMKNDSMKWGKFKELVETLTLPKEKVYRLMMMDEELESFLNKLNISSINSATKVIKNFIMDIKKSDKNLIYEYRILNNLSIIKLITEHHDIEDNYFSNKEYLFALTAAILDNNFINYCETNTNDYNIDLQEYIYIKIKKITNNGLLPQLQIYNN